MKIFIEDIIEDGQEKGKLYIESDTYGYQVRLYNGTRFDTKLKRDVEVYQTLGNYSTVKGCSKFVLNLKIKQSTAGDLKELLQDVKRIEAYLEEKISI